MHRNRNININSAFTEKKDSAVSHSTKADLWLWVSLYLSHMGTLIPVFVLQEKERLSRVVPLCTTPLPIYLQFKQELHCSPNSRWKSFTEQFLALIQEAISASNKVWFVSPIISKLKRLTVQRIHRLTGEEPLLPLQETMKCEEQRKRGKCQLSWLAGLLHITGGFRFKVLLKSL